MSLWYLIPNVEVKPKVDYMIVDCCFNCGYCEQRNLGKYCNKLLAFIQSNGYCIEHTNIPSIMEENLVI